VARAIMVVGVISGPGSRHGTITSLLGNFDIETGLRRNEE